MTDDSLVPDNNNQLSSSSSFSVCTSSSHESAIEPLSASPQSGHCPEMMMMMLNHTHPDHIDHHHFPSLNPKAITSPSSSSHSPTSAHIRPLSDLVPNSVIHNGDQFGPVPNMYKWLHHQIARLEQHHNKSPSSSPQRGTSTDQPNQMVDIAMSKEEQNLEIIYQNGEYYFEAIHSFRVRTFDSKGKTKLESISYCDVPSKACKAWLAKEIESKLVLKPGKSWLNGTETYYCLMCNLFSPHSNLILLHMILSCPKLNSQNASLQTEDIQNYSPPKDANNNNNSSSSNGVKLYSPSKAPRRSFDIMSLLNRTNSDPTPEFTRISSDDNISDDDDSDEKIDVETLEDDHDESRMHFGTLLRPIGAEGAMRSAVNFDTFGSMVPNGHVPRKSANRSNTRQPRAPKAQNSNIFAGSYPTMSNKPVKNARQTNSTRQPKSAFKKPKVSEHVNLDLIGTNGKRGPVSENLVPNMMVPNLANLYSQFGSSLFANTFASFFNQSNQSTHQSSASLPNSSSMLGPVMDHAFGSNYGSSSSLFPPTGNHLGSLGSLRNSASLEPNSPPKFINSNLSPSKLPSPAGASPYPSGSTHPRFDMLNQASPSLSNGPSSIMTSSSLASNSPGSLSESSSTTTSSSISPTSLVSISPKSHSNHDFDHKSSANRGSDHKEPKSRKGHRTQSPTSPTVSPPNGLNLPPYFMPPSTTASSTAPLLSSMYLLSPSLTALSYQAGNVCAYCNTTFRMTSDLVYHMRSHHKSAIGPRDTNSGKNKRRNDALKCNICQETFRERHHLTRHMTSHQ